jgi:hypothetical protein
VDVDSLLSELNSEAPFKTLHMCKHGGLKENQVPDKVLIALAHSKDPELTSLTIYSVPRSLAGTIRLLMKEQGLPKIFARFRAWNLKPETWRLAKHTFALWFHTNTTELIFEDEYLN